MYTHHLASFSLLSVLTLMIGCLLARPVSAAESADVDVLGLPRADSTVDVQTLLHRAERGDPRASFLLGTRYASGRAGVRDDSEAVRWFTRAAEAGLAEAQYNLGIMYANGRGVASNMQRAAHWYEQAAKQGVVEAQYNLGTLYSVGLGVEKNQQTAADWLLRAARKGLTEAEYNLGVLYEHGRGVRVDANAAMEWYSRAAKKGYEPAKQRLLELTQKLGVAAAAIAVSGKIAPESETLAAEAAPESTRLRSNKWIASLDPGQYTLQLMSQNSEPSAVDFIQKRNLHTDAAYFVWKQEGTTWYSVIYGLYDSYQKASAAGASLPAVIADVKPWIRNIGAIHKLIEQR